MWKGGAPKNNAFSQEGWPESRSRRTFWQNVYFRQSALVMVFSLYKVNFQLEPEQKYFENRLLHTNMSPPTKRCGWSTWDLLVLCIKLKLHKYWAVWFDVTLQNFSSSLELWAVDVVRNIFKNYAPSKEKTVFFSLSPYVSHPQRHKIKQKYILFGEKKAGSLITRTV